MGKVESSWVDYAGLIVEYNSDTRLERIEGTDFRG